MVPFPVGDFAGRVKESFGGIWSLVAEEGNDLDCPLRTLVSM
jgi:hypothetical protein